MRTRVLTVTTFPSTVRVRDMGSVTVSGMKRIFFLRMLVAEKSAAFSTQEVEMVGLKMPKPSMRTAFPLSKD